MKRSLAISAAALILLCSNIVLADEEFAFGPFGKVFLYQEKALPRAVVLFISGDGGWNKGVVETARSLSGLGAVVVGIDITRYLRVIGSSKERCAYPAADFEALSKYVQKRLDLSRYMPPILVGYSSGATLVYAVLAQAPPNTFRGGISMGFCPDLAIRKPLCKGSGLVSQHDPLKKSTLFLPGRKLHSPWTVLQGTIDKVCSAEETGSFVRNVPGADIVLLPHVGHGFAVERHWLPEFIKAFDRLVQVDTQTGAQHASLADLPLVEVPAQNDRSDMFAVIISGDGGWAGLDRDVGDALAQRGIPVVGLNALQYFWTARTPEGASEDLARVLQHYRRAWNKKDFLLVGYSLGADVLPFMANRLPADLLDHVREIVLLGPGRRTAFEFHLTEWLGASGHNTRPVQPEVEKLRNRNVLCLYGSEEAASLCPLLGRGTATVMPMPGGHHFGGNYGPLSDLILKHAGVMQ
jgi:type IV secretory pathway VirJ component